jgi:hypothetical protein
MIRLSYGGKARPMMALKPSLDAVYSCVSELARPITELDGALSKFISYPSCRERRVNRNKQLRDAGATLASFLCSGKQCFSVHLDLHVPTSKCICSHCLHVEAKVVIVPHGLGAGREPGFRLGSWDVLIVKRACEIVMSCASMRRRPEMLAGLAQTTL